MRRKIIVALVVIILASTVVGLFINQANLKAQKDAVFGGLVYQVGDFYGEKQRLPLSWKEFVAWNKTDHRVSVWHEGYLTSRFALQWGARLTSHSPNDEKLFVVLDPKFKDIETSANDALVQLCIGRSTAR